MTVFVGKIFVVFVIEHWTTNILPTLYIHVVKICSISQLNLILQSRQIKYIT